MADYSDNFNRDNESPLAAPWATGTGASDGIYLVSNAAKSGDSEDRSYYNDTFANDQYSSCKIPTAVADWYGPTVRDQASSKNHYWLNCGALLVDDDIQVYKVVVDAYTAIGAVVDIGTYNAAHAYRIEVVGTGFEVFANGVSKGTRGPDATFSSGYAGLFDWGTGAVMDDWEGGDVSAGSASASVSPSVSPSASVSPSVSPSASVSPSPSVSPSVSPSASVSPSISPSASVSPSPSPGVGMDVVWGHDTGVLEANVRNFQGNWTGTGAIENAGVADTERLALDSGEYMISEMVDTGALAMEVLINEYQAGDAVTVEYRHGATPNDCAVAGWIGYVGQFDSLGYVQIRLTSTL